MSVGVRRLVSVMLAAAALAGCGSSAASDVSVPKVAPARTFSLAGFQPAGSVERGRPTTISFVIQQPNGRPLTTYKTGPGPHTGIHLIIVRDDLTYIIHQHPPVGAGGMVHQTVTFPAPGPYRVLVDAYPNLPGGQSNFQLLRSVEVAGAYDPRPLPPFKPDLSVDGYHVDMQGNPALHAIQAQFVNVEVTDAHGAKVNFVPWFGALAHAIFFHEGSLDYFHTHVCAPGALNCSSVLGATRISGQSTSPGRLTLGVLLPVPGAWRLFLQMKLGGRVVTAPYTLQVAS
ncbi:MAG: hypothetical protein JO168_21655 [Solirubrobacterales bacterium]|nr:hypothetical protein [Solirubrobacterales bacterium]MBV9715743.1 hypothetical protein [Solirubrobacterales bacterium]